MKSWLAKFQISRALDEGKPLSPRLQRQLRASKELRGFAEEAEALERGLKVGPPEPEVPAALHGSIMRAVRTAERASVVKPGWSVAMFLRPAIVALVLLCCWWLLHAPANRPVASGGVGQRPLAPAVTALELGETMTQTMPAAMLAPLSEEWERIVQDVDKTAQFLMASLP